MDKNENGYPCRCKGSCGNTATFCQNNNTGGNGGDINGGNGCGGRGDCLDGMPLAYVYAPDQTFRMLYTANDALRHGTLFEELYKPMEVYGRE